jgi:uncharacterized membrane protein
MHTLVLIHIATATIALVAGFLAMVLRKGSGLHNASGTVFFVSMLGMAGTANFLSVFHKPNMANFVVSLLTIYLVTTARSAARRKDGATNARDLVAFLAVLAVAVMGWSFGFEAATSPKGMKDQMPAAVYFMFGTIALICAYSDLRMLIRRSLTGAYRIRRHLFRMSGALLIATLSFFPGQARNLPPSLRRSPIAYAPHIFLVGSIVYWGFKTRRRRPSSGRLEAGEPAGWKPALPARASP